MSCETPDKRSTGRDFFPFVSRSRWQEGKYEYDYSIRREMPCLYYIFFAVQKGRSKQQYSRRETA
jgi:hypothetical protein